MNVFNNDMYDRMIKFTTEVKFVKNRYTTPVTIEFSSSLKMGGNTINVVVVHHKIFAGMKLLDPFVKFVSETKVFKHSKDFTTDNEYKK